MSEFFFFHFILILASELFLYNILTILLAELILLFVTVHNIVQNACSTSNNNSCSWCFRLGSMTLNCVRSSWAGC